MPWVYVYITATRRGFKPFPPLAPRVFDVRKGGRKRVEPVSKQDPKYDFVDGRIWNRNGGYFLPDDEPVMVLRGKDQASLAAIFGYIECLEKQPQTPHVLEHIRTSRERLNAFFEFQTSKPERTGIGCTVAEKLQTTTHIYAMGADKVEV